MHLPKLSRVKDQGWNNRSSPLGEIRTKDEPRNDQRNNRSSTREIRTPNYQNVRFHKIAVSFTSLIPSPILPTDDRETTERTPTQLPVSKKCYFLRLHPNKVVLIPRKVDYVTKLIDYNPKKVNYHLLSYRYNAPSHKLKIEYFHYFLVLLWRKLSKIKNKIE